MSASMCFDPCDLCKAQGKALETLCHGCQHNKRVIETLFDRLEPASLSGTTAVCRMRDQFLQAVTAYNIVHQFDEALEAQAIAIALHKFEDAHDITLMRWPPSVIEVDGCPEIADVDD